MGPLFSHGLGLRDIRWHSGPVHHAALLVRPCIAGYLHRRNARTGRRNDRGTQMIEHRSHTYGVLGEFDTEHQLITAAEKTREAGYKHFEAYAPFPVEGLSEALGLKRNKVPLITLIGG